MAQLFVPNGAPARAKRNRAGLSGKGVICKIANRFARLMATITLYRPVGQAELDLIATSGYQAFPPRLPEQPIFYPVLNRPYAEQIARDWNTRDERSGYVGYVTEFDVDADYLGRFEVKKVGGTEHLEYWIPAKELETFNRHIRGAIRVVNRFAKS